MDRPTRRALLQSLLGVGAGYVAGEYGLDDDNDLVRSVQQIDEPPSRPLPPAAAPTYRWRRPLPAPESKMVAFDTDYIALHTGTHVVAIDISDGTTAGKYPAPDDHRETLVVDGYVISIGRSRVAGVDTDSGAVFETSIDAEAEVYDDSVAVEDGILVFQTDAGVRAHEWATGAERWRTEQRQELHHVGSVFVIAGSERVSVRRAGGTEILDVAVDSENPIGLRHDSLLVLGSVNGVFTDAGGGLLAGGVPTAIFGPDGDVERGPMFNESPSVEITADNSRGIVSGEVDGKETVLVADLLNPSVVGHYRATRGVGFGDSVIVAATAETVVAIDRGTGSVAWRRDDLRPLDIVGSLDAGVVLRVASGKKTERYVVLSEADGAVHSEFESTLVVAEEGFVDRPYGPTFVGPDGVLAVDDRGDTIELAFSIPFVDPVVEACTDQVLLIRGEQTKELYDARTGAKFTTLGPDSTVSVSESGTDSSVVIAAGTTGDERAFWVTPDGTVSTRSPGNDGVDWVAIYRDSVLVVTADQSMSEDEDAPVDVELLRADGEVLYTASDVRLRSPDDTGVYVVSNGESRSLLRPDGTTEPIPGDGSVTVYQTSDDSLVVRRGRHLLGYGHSALRSRWRITNETLRGIVSNDGLVYVGRDGVACVDAETGVAMYIVDPVQGFHRYEQFNRFADDETTPSSPITIADGEIGRIDEFDAMARAGIESLRRDALGVSSSVDEFREAAAAALREGDERRAQRLVSMGVARLTYESPAEFDGVAGAVHRTIAGILGYDQVVERVDAAARDGSFTRAGRRLFDVEALLQRATAIGAGLAATLGAGIAFTAALVRERTLEPDRLEADARHRIRAAGAACSRAHARGAAVDELHAAWEALEDERYTEAIETADTAIENANREADILRRLADHEETSVETLRQPRTEPFYDQLWRRLEERFEAELGEDEPTEPSRSVAERLAEGEDDHDELDEETDLHSDQVDTGENGEDETVKDGDDEQTSTLSDRVIESISEGAYDDAERLIQDARQEARDQPDGDPES